MLPQQGGQTGGTRPAGLLTFPSKLSPGNSPLHTPGPSAWVSFPLAQPGHFLSLLKPQLDSQLPFEAFPHHPGESPSTHDMPLSWLFSVCCLPTHLSLPESPPQGQELHVIHLGGTQALERGVWNVMRGCAVSA